MKILYKGFEPKDTPLRAKCGNCKAEIEFSKSEARDTGLPAPFGKYVVSCPVCHRQITTDGDYNSGYPRPPQ